MSHHQFVLSGSTVAVTGSGQVAEIVKDSINLLLALHDVWQFVPKGQKKSVAELLRRHGDFADMHEWSQEPVYRCRGCGHIYQDKVWCDCGDKMLVCDEGVARFSRLTSAA